MDGSATSQGADFLARIAALEAECAALRAREAANRLTVEQASRRLTFLAESSAMLARSLDYETTLATVTRLAIPFLGDSCVLHLIDQDGTIRYIEQAHIVAEKEEAVRRLRQRHPLTWESDHPLVHVLRTGQPFVTSDISTDIRAHVADDGEGLAILDALAYRSVLIVPLVVRGEVRGALSLIISERDAVYTPEDVLFAGELANRAAQAIENARLYHAAQEALQAKDALLGELQRTQQQLLHAQRLESIGRLAAGVAHDFNNLLTVIGGYAQLAAADADQEDPSQHGLEQINLAVERAAALTRQLLAFARKQPFAAEPTDLRAVLHNTEKLIQRLIGEDIQFSLQVAADLWSIHADPRQIEQVLLNLAVNARDAMPDGGTLELTAANVQLAHPYDDVNVYIPPGEYVRLSLRDSGSGIAPDVQLHIFEPFFTTKEPGKGTGLGLATCYGIIQQHSGFITLTSAPGHGTTFMIYLPRVPAAEAQSGDGTRVAGAGVGGTETILVVEDEPMVRALVAQILRERGYTVLLADNGQAALAMLEHTPAPPIAMLISDVRMPHMNGPELLRRLRAQGRNIPALFVSGYTDSYLSEDEIRSSNAGLIYKPFAAEHLVRTVRQMLDQPDASVPLRTSS